MTYHRRFLAWWAVGLFLFKLGSRRQLDFELGDEGTYILANLNRLAGTDQESLPVHQTLEHFLSHVDVTAWAELRAQMIRRLIRMKALDDGRLQGHLVVAMDATGWLSFDHQHCPNCLTQRQGDHTTYFHLVLEAKLLGPAGLALSLGTEFIDQQPDPSLPADQRKQDCELKAMTRLAPSLKRDFPQPPFCLIGDALIFNTIEYWTDKNPIGPTSSADPGTGGEARPRIVRSDPAGPDGGGAGRPVGLGPQASRGEMPAASPFPGSLRFWKSPSP